MDPRFSGRDDSVHLEKGNPFEQRQRLLSEKKFTEEVLLKVLGRRLEKAGFRRGNFEEVHFILENDQFLSYIAQKKLIIDRTFSADGHGEFIHVFQMDFLTFLVQNRGISPREVGKFYEWIGSGQMIELRKGLHFETGNDIWDTFFDGYNMSIYRPEIFNGKIEEVISL